MRTSLLLFVLAFLFISNTFPQENFIPIDGPYETFSIYTMIMDQDSSLYIAKSYSGGIMKSTDGGNTWVNKSDSIGTKGVNAFAITSDGMIFACAGNYIYSSSDKGEHWKLRKTVNFPAMSITILPNHTIIIGTEGAGIFRSTDTGNSWLECTGLSQNHLVEVVNDGIDCYALTWSNGIFKSTNNGISWFASNNGIPTIGTSYIRSSSVTIKNDGTIFYSGNEKVYKSNNGGNSWQYLSDLRKHAKLTLDSAGNLFAAMSPYSHGVQASYDNGLTWVEYALPLNVVEDIIIYGPDIYCCTMGLYRIRDSVAQRIFYEDRRAVTVGKIYVTQDGRLFASGRYEGLYLSTNFGNTWDHIIPDFEIKCLSVNSKGEIFAGVWESFSGIGLIKSSDNGLTWKRLDINYNPNCLLIDKDDHILIGFQTSGLIYKSTNDGVSWSIFHNFTQEPTTSSIIEMFKVKDSTYLVTVNAYMYDPFGGWSRKSIYRSHDNGISWVEVYYSQLFRSYAYDGNGNILTLGSSKLLMTSDGGDVWINYPGAPSTTQNDYALNNSYDLFVNAGYQMYKKNFNDTAWVKFSNVGCTQIETYQDSLIFVIMDDKIYKRSQVVINDVRDGEESIDYSLIQNYPNPFNPSTTIEYTLAVESNVELVIYNILGERVKEEKFLHLQPGRNSYIFNGSDLSSGVFIYTLTSHSTDGQQNFSSSRKMILLK